MSSMFVSSSDSRLHAGFSVTQETNGPDERVLLKSMVLWAEWGMYHQICDEQDVSREGRRSQGVNMKTGPYGEVGI